MKNLTRILSGIYRNNKFLALNIIETTSFYISLVFFKASESPGAVIFEAPKTRVTIFFRQKTETVVVLRDFSDDLRKKKVFTPATHVFSRIFEWSSQTNKKPGHFHQPAGTPGHGLKTGTVSLPKT